MLIEASTSAAAGEVTGIFDGTTDLQKNWLDLIVNLFHYKSGSDEYGVEAAKYGHKPLYVKTAGGAGNTMLNEVFCYIVSKLGDFQNLRHHAPRSMEEVETFVTSAFPAVPSTKHHIELPTTSYVSKHFVAYIEASVGAAPYFRTTDPRMRLDARFAKTLSELNKQDDLRFDQVHPVSANPAGRHRRRGRHRRGAGRPGGGWGGG